MDAPSQRREESAVPSPFRVGLVAAATVAAMVSVVGTLDVAARKLRPPPCPGGFYMVDGAPLVSSGLGVPDAVVIQGRSLSVLSGCDATTAKLKGTRRGTRIKAKWSSCTGVAGGVRLRARIDPTCTT